MSALRPMAFLKSYVGGQEQVELPSGGTVVVLHTEGCPATPKTLALIKECIQELGLHVDLQEVQISTQEEAEARRFLGSPTVQVNGVDIDPAARDSTVFGFM